MSRMMSRMMSLALIAGLACVMPACAGSGAQRRGDDGPMSDASPYEFHLAMAQTLLRTEQPRQAIMHVRKLQILAPKRAEPFMLMARAYMQLGVNEAAHEMLDRALERDPKLTAAHSARAVLLDRQGEHAKAEAEHRQALLLAPDKPTLYNNLGFNLYLQGRFSEAVSAYEGALVLDGGNRRIHNNIGFARGLMGQFDKAVEHFRLAGAPAEAENNLGLVHEKLGNLEHARECYVVALRADPSLAAARVNLRRVSHELDVDLPEDLADSPIESARPHGARGATTGAKNKPVLEEISVTPIDTSVAQPPVTGDEKGVVR